MKIDLNDLKSQAVYFFRQHGPNIAIVGGVAGLVASGVLACFATTKVDKVKEKHKTRIGVIKKESPDDKKALTIGYLKTAGDFAKLYGPSVVLGGLSATSILVGNHILKGRVIGLTAAYATLDGSYRQYRKRVVDKFGEETDHELMFGTRQKKIETTVTDETGKEKKVKQTVDVYSSDISGYTRWFTPDSSMEAQGSMDYDLCFLNAQLTYVNEKFRANKFMFLNDVLDLLGFEKTITGQHVGWVYDKHGDDHGDNLIDFGTRVVMREKPDGSGKMEKAILLEFNVDGPIFQHALDNGLITE